MMMGRAKTMENEKRNFIAEHALLTEENFLLAAQVEKSFEEIMNRLVGNLLGKLKEELIEILGTDWEVENNFEKNAFDKNWSFVIFKKSWADDEYAFYWFGFEPDKRKLGDFYFFAERNSELIKTPLTAVYQALNEQYKKGRKARQDWWQYVDQDYQNWTHEETLVKLYRQEEMLKYFTEQFIIMKNIIEPIVDEEMKKYSK